MGIIEYINNSETLTVLLKLLLSVVLSGMIGIERGYERQPAGFRTHVVVCLGACLVMMTNLYLFDHISSHTDVARLGAQVVTGVGFLGAGTILVTGRQKIRGLTTAAGLWASACVGLAIGAGFYVAGIFTALIMFFSFTVLARLEDILYSRSPILNLYFEVDNMEHFRQLMNQLDDFPVVVKETRLSTDKAVVVHDGIGFFIIVKADKGISKKDVVSRIRGCEGVVFVEVI